MASVTVVSTESAFPFNRLPKIHCHPWLSSMVFFGCDAIALVASGSVVLLGMRAGGGGIDIHRYVELWPALGLFFAVFGYSKLYPGIIHNAVTELRRLGFALSIGFLMLGGSLFLTWSNDYPRAMLVLWWLTALVLTPVLRSVVRELVCRKHWWGVPVAVFYTGDESRAIIAELEAHPEIGLRPVVILASPQAMRPRHRLPVMDMRFAAAVRAGGVERAMIALPDAGCGKLLEDLEMFESIFPAADDHP